MLSKEVKHETWCYEISGAVQQLQDPGGACHDRRLKARQAEYFVLLFEKNKALSDHVFVRIICTSALDHKNA